jgi:hypothetical protein
VLPRLPGLGPCADPLAIEKFQKYSEEGAALSKMG